MEEPKNYQPLFCDNCGERIGWVHARYDVVEEVWFACDACMAAHKDGPICAGCHKGIDRHDPDGGNCLDVDYAGGQRWSFACPGDTMGVSWTKFKAAWEALKATHKRGS